MTFSLASIFGGKPAPQQVPPQMQQTPGNNPMNNPAPVVVPQQTPQTAANGVVPNTAQDPSAAPVSPLAAFQDLWKDKPVDPNAPVDPNSVQVTPEQFMEAAGKIDFAKSIPQDALAKITAGGPEAAAAFVEAINKVVQVSFGQSLAASQKIATRQVDAARKEFSSKLPNTLKNQNIRESLREKNVNLTDPAVAPVFDAMLSQLTDKFPTASEAELRAKAEEYVTNLGKAFAPTPPAAKQEVPKEEDWSDLA